MTGTNAPALKNGLYFALKYKNASCSRGRWGRTWDACRPSASPDVWAASQGKGCAYAWCQRLFHLQSQQQVFKRLLSWNKEVDSRYPFHIGPQRLCVAELLSSSSYQRPSWPAFPSKALACNPHESTTVGRTLTMFNGSSLHLQAWLKTQVRKALELRDLEASQ